MSSWFAKCARQRVHFEGECQSEGKGQEQKAQNRGEGRSGRNSSRSSAYIYWRQTGHQSQDRARIVASHIWLLCAMRLKQFRAGRGHKNYLTCKSRRSQQGRLGREGGRLTAQSENFFNFKANTRRAELAEQGQPRRRRGGWAGEAAARADRRRLRWL